MTMCVFRANTPIITSDRRPDIYFRSNGCIDIMATTTRLLDIHDGDVINVLPTDTREYILFISHRANASSVARYRNACRPTKPRSRNMRCQSKQLTDAINLLTDAAESWLYVGLPIDMSRYGIQGKGLPLIYHNNQYPKQ